MVSLLRRVVPLSPDADARSALATLGLERFGPPILLFGQFLLDGFRVPPHPIYFGLPPATAGGLRFSIVPAYVLTIENFASFNRHVSETDPERRGLTLYAGGYPSLAVQCALASISAALPSTVPFYHWSDIDPDGTWIFRTVEKAIGRRLLPHLMTVELAERHGDWPTRPSAYVAERRKDQPLRSWSISSRRIRRKIWSRKKSTLACLCCATRWKLARCHIPDREQRFHIPDSGVSDALLPGEQTRLQRQNRDPSPYRSHRQDDRRGPCLEHRGARRASPALSRQAGHCVSTGPQKQDRHPA